MGVTHVSILLWWLGAINIKQKVIMKKSIVCFMVVIIMCNCTLRSSVKNQVEISKILSLIDSAKGGDRYNNVSFLAGYHSLCFDGIKIPGLRDPIKRLAKVPYDFTGKVVLDIGTNQGGMLFAVAGKIKQGVGIDFNPKLINVANKIKSFTKKENLDFYTFDLDKDRVNTIKSFLPSSKVDICFFLAMCAWVKQWKQVIDFAASIAPTLLFESNGKNQDEQIQYLKQRYTNVVFIDECINRQVFLCQNN